MAAELIAVIDDDATFLEIMDLLLTDEGYRTLLRQTGAGADAAIRAAQPDLVLLDLRLERRDGGLAVLARLRRDPTTCTIPIIVCSADTLALQQQAERLREQGYDLLPKPFDLDDLLSKVQAAVRPGRLVQGARVGTRSVSCPS